MSNNNLYDLEQAINHFISSDEIYRYHYSLEFKSEQVYQYVEKKHLPILKYLSTDYYEVYKVNDSLYFLWDKGYESLELFKNIKLVEEEVTERKEADSMEYDEDIVQYSLKRFNPSLLNETISIKRNLIERFGLDKSALDYSIESLKYLDEVIENNKVGSKFIKQNLLDLSFYIGAIYIKEEGGEWRIYDFQEGLKLPMLISKKGKAINLVRTVYNSLTQEYGGIIRPSGIYRVTTKNMFRIE